jgi:hypothetical protein
VGWQGRPAEATAIGWAACPDSAGGRSTRRVSAHFAGGRSTRSGSARYESAGGRSTRLSAHFAGGRSTRSGSARYDDSAGGTSTRRWMVEYGTNPAAEGGTGIADGIRSRSEERLLVLWRTTCKPRLSQCAVEHAQPAWPAAAHRGRPAPAEWMATASRTRRKHALSAVRQMGTSPGELQGDQRGRLRGRGRRLRV